jgi:thiol-disulfide isomerase/thioredoxin
MKKVTLAVSLTLLASAVIWLTRHAYDLTSWAPKQNLSLEEDINRPSPEVVFRGLDDHWTPLNQYRGKVIFVIFWATWCSYCREEFPTLIQLQEENGAKGFVVLAVAIDDEGEEGVKSFVQNRTFPVNGTSAAVNFPVFLGNSDVFEKFGLRGGVPDSFLISREGRQVKHIVGPVDYQQVSGEIKSLL